MVSGGEGSRKCLKASSSSGSSASSASSKPYCWSVFFEIDVECWSSVLRVKVRKGLFWLLLVYFCYVSSSHLFRALHPYSRSLTSSSSPINSSFFFVFNSFFETPKPLSILTVLHCHPSPHFPALLGLINSTLVASRQDYHNLTFHIGIPTPSLPFSSFSSRNSHSPVLFDHPRSLEYYVCGAKASVHSSDDEENATSEYPGGLTIGQLSNLLSELFPEVTFRLYPLPQSAMPRESQYESFFMFGINHMESSLGLEEEGESEEEKSEDTRVILFLKLHSYFHSSLPRLNAAGSNFKIVQSLKSLSFYYQHSIEIPKVADSISVTPPEDWFRFFDISTVQRAAAGLGLRTLLFPRDSKRIYVFASQSAGRLTANLLLNLRKFDLQEEVCIITFEPGILKVLRTLRIKHICLEMDLWARQEIGTEKDGMLFKINTPTFGRVMKWRGSLIDRKMRLGESFIHNDADNVWKDNHFFDNLSDNSHCDIQWMVDTHTPLSDDAILNPKSRPELWLNGGFYRITNNVRTRNFFHQISAVQEQSPHLIREQPSIVQALEELPNKYEVYVSSVPPKARLLRSLQDPEGQLKDAENPDIPLRICALSTKVFQNGNLHFSRRLRLFEAPSGLLPNIQERTMQKEGQVSMLHYNNVRIGAKEFCMALNGDWELEDVLAKNIFSSGVMKSIRFKACFTPDTWELYRAQDLTSLLPTKRVTDSFLLASFDD